jgi:hypothetical protein
MTGSIEERGYSSDTDYMEKHYGAIVSCESDLAPSKGRLTRIKQDLMLLQSIPGNAG